MLARASSDAGTRLRRSKSTSTVQRPPPPILEPLDHDAARQQALAAATTAFARAHVFDADERRAQRSFDMSRSKSNASRKSGTSQGQGSHFPPRGSSFRASQPKKAKPGTEMQPLPQVSTINTERFPPFPPSHPVPSMDTPASATRPLCTQPSIAFGEHSRPNTQPKSGRHSVVSSITSQQIRKARSMYYASSVQTGSPIARPPALYLTTPPAASTSATSDVSTPILPSRTLVPSPLAERRIPATVAPDESVDTARDKVLQDFQQRSVKHKPSLFLAPFIKRKDRGKDKNRPLSSGFTAVSIRSQRTPDELTIDATVDDLPPPDKKDKRSFSGSLKNKIKRVFRRTSKSSLQDLPVQQIQASRDYFGAMPVEFENCKDVYSIPTPEPEVLRRVRSRNHSIEAGRPTFFKPGSRTSSNGSARSDHSSGSLHSEMHAANASGSRVSSWAMTATEPLDSRAIKRLTVIHESKDSIGSEADRAASVTTKRKSLPPSALAAFRDPMPMESLLAQTSTPVDPKRVFSALMKEIGISKSREPMVVTTDRTPGAESDVFESSRTKVLHSSGRELQSSASSQYCPSTSHDQRPPSRQPPSDAVQSTHSKPSSIRSFGRAIRSTIRTATPGERSSPLLDQPVVMRGALDISIDHPETSSSPVVSNEEEDCVNIDSVLAHSSRIPRSRLITSRAMYDDSPTNLFSPSAAQIEKRILRAKDRWKTPLDDVEVPQFPRETDRTYNVANITQESVGYGLSRRSIDHMEVVRTDVPISSATPTSPIPRPIMSPMSPSIYSRNTDGISILPNDSVMSFNGHDELERHHNEGSAVILTSQSVRSYVIGTPSPRRPGSSRSSRDWKTWLSSEVASIESSSQEDLKIRDSYLTPSGKRRENLARTSHTEHDETTVVLRNSCDTVTTHADEDATPSKNLVRTRDLHRAQIAPREKQRHTMTKLTVLEKWPSHTDTFKEVSPGNTPPADVYAQEKPMVSQSRSSFSLYRPHVVSTPSPDSSVSRALLETLTPTQTHEHFASVHAIRGSGCNSSQSPHLSISPPERRERLRKSTVTPSPRKQSILNTIALSESSQRISDGGTSQHKTKENATPPSRSGNRLGIRPNISPLGLGSRTKSLQPLSSASFIRSHTNVGQYVSNVPDIKHLRHDSSPVATAPRPRLRGTIRSISPEKLNRRPKSAFDLRSGPNTSLPRPTSDSRRPVLQLKASTSSLGQSRGPSPGVEGRVIEAVLEDGGIERSGGTTPGQIMADRFIRERKSAGVLEGKRRGGLRLVREDTPAFL
jgi:hypothetical protein